MGHRLLHQSHAAGGIGAIPARSANSRDSREKVKAGGRRPAPVPPKTLARFVILQDSARYPSGPRERSAKPPFVGSNPTRASKVFNHLRTSCLNPANKVANRIPRMWLPREHAQTPRHGICSLRIGTLREMHVVLHGCFGARVTQSFLCSLDRNTLIMQDC